MTRSSARDLAATLLRRTDRLLRYARWRVRRLIDPSCRHDIVYTDLGRGWHDADEVLLHAAFQVLRRYVEWEVPGTGGCHVVGPEAAALHRWWTVERPAEVAAIDALLHDKARWLEMGARERALYDLETEAICRLARIRGGLWT